MLEINFGTWNKWKATSWPWWRTCKCQKNSWRKRLFTQWFSSCLVVFTTSVTWLEIMAYESLQSSNMNLCFPLITFFSRTQSRSGNSSLAMTWSSGYGTKSSLRWDLITCSSTWDVYEATHKKEKSATGLLWRTWDKLSSTAKPKFCLKIALLLRTWPFSTVRRSRRTSLPSGSITRETNNLWLNGCAKTKARSHPTDQQIARTDFATSQSSSECCLARRTNSRKRGTIHRLLMMMMS